MHTQARNDECEFYGPSCVPSKFDACFVFYAQYSDVAMSATEYVRRRWQRTELEINLEEKKTPTVFRFVNERTSQPLVTA